MGLSTDAKTKEDMDHQIVMYLRALEQKKQALEHTYKKNMKQELLKAADSIEGSTSGPLGAVRLRIPIELF